MKENEGKKVIVRSRLAGVHAGIVEKHEGNEVILKDAYRLWRVYTRDKNGSVSDIAAKGLMKNKEHQIGAKLKSVTIVEPQGLELAEMTDEAYESLDKWTYKYLSYTAMDVAMILVLAMAVMGAVAVALVMAVV